MGEYVNYHEDHIKLGTCENLYYYTFDQLDAILPHCSALPGNDKPMSYLNPNNGYRYRFPFPVDQPPDSPDFDFDRGAIVTIPDECKHEEHNPIWLSMHPRNTNAYNINVEVACPMNPVGGNNKYSNGYRRDLAEIVQQKQVDGQLWTVLRCPYCHSMWRLPPEEAALLVYHLAEEYPELAARICEGYTRQL